MPLPLDLIRPAEPAVLGEPAPVEPLAPPHLNTRFDGVAPNAPLVVGRRVPLRGRAQDAFYYDGFMPFFIELHTRVRPLA